MKTIDDLYEEWAREEIRHIRKLRFIRRTGWAMQALIVAVFLFFIFAPLFL